VSLPLPPPEEKNYGDSDRKGDRGRVHGKRHWRSLNTRIHIRLEAQARHNRRKQHGCGSNSQAQDLVHHNLPLRVVFRYYSSQFLPEKGSAGLAGARKAR
jgi:hypothetical protein